MTASIGQAKSAQVEEREPRSFVARCSDALTSTPGLVLLFLALQVVAAMSFRGVEAGWPNGRLNWDGEHFAELASQGYPPLGAEAPDTALPSYAFFPLYPMLIRMAAAVTGLSITVVAPLISITAATVALYAADRWLRGVMGAAGAAALFVGLVVSPAFPVLQMAYTEGVALLLLVLALRALSARRWWTYGVAVTLLSLTRPLAVPLAVVTLVLVIRALRHGERGRSLRALVLAMVFTGLSAAIWPAIAWAMTGRPTTYLDAMATFPRDADVPTVVAAALVYPTLGLVVFAVVGVCVWVGVRVLPAQVPMVLRTWVVVYPMYIVMAAVPSSSPLRYLLFEFPIALVLVPWMRRPGWRAMIVLTAAVASIALSSWWVHTFVPSTIDGTLP